jgi:hypothetical protein
MENEKIGEMMMFGAMVSFCSCPVCKGFLEVDGQPMPIKLGRIVEGEKESDGPGAEDIVDRLDS